ncbi:MAG: hypothetical protein KatS3mg053_1319 [Candidatus Roseilinea sp.]|nr:MAG: hypothetical protein KatS3mg053_1319 [Candidatus Roseilinea sp.]
MNSEELGYYLYPAARAGDPGYPRLDVNIFAAPTHRHYDTRVLHLPVAHFGSVRQMDIRHPWHVAHYRVCAGRITLRDFVDKPVVFFSFGGNAAVEVRPDRTHCTITSDAPILHLIEEEDAATLLGEEFEALLARRRGAWAGRQDQYESRLVKVEPVALYLACLNALRHALDEHAHSADDGRTAVRHILHDAIHAMEESGRRTELAPTLEQLL